MLNINEKAPLEIELKDQTGKLHKLGDYLGKYIVLYFYPKDNTPGCTLQACSLRDANEELQKHGVEVIGVSKDSSQSHMGFIEKQRLNFTLLSDPEAELQKIFGVWVEKKMFGKSYFGTQRSTFLIDPNGVIVYRWEKAKTVGHADEVLKVLQSL